MTTKTFRVMYATREDLNGIIERYENDDVFAAMDGYDMGAAKRFLAYMNNHGLDDVYYMQIKHGDLMIIPYELGISITTEITPLEQDNRQDCFYNAAKK